MSTIWSVLSPKLCLKIHQSRFFIRTQHGDLCRLNVCVAEPGFNKGLIILSCPLELASSFAKSGSVVGKTFSGIAPRLKIPTCIDPDDLTDDARIIDEFN